MEFLQTNYMFLLTFIGGCCLGYIADFLALAWHQEDAVFKKEKIRGFLNNNKLPYKRWPMLAGGYFAVILYNGFGLTIDFCILSFLTFAFGVALISDIRWREIPHELNHLIFAVAVFLLLTGKISLFSFLAGITPAILLTIVVFLLYLIFPSKGLGMGGGDLRFLFSTGALMGIYFALSLIIFGTLITLLLNIISVVKDLLRGTTTTAAMMIGFSLAYLYILYGEYLVPPFPGAPPFADLITYL